MQPRWKDPMQTFEGELLLIVKQLESAIIKQTEKAGMCKNSMCKNMNCMGGCGKSDDKGNYMEKASMDKKRTNTAKRPSVAIIPNAHQVKKHNAISIVASWKSMMMIA